jgi:hypothetical protein
MAATANSLPLAVVAPLPTVADPSEADCHVVPRIANSPQEDCHIVEEAPNPSPPWPVTKARATHSQSRSPRLPPTGCSTQSRGM